MKDKEKKACGHEILARGEALMRQRDFDSALSTLQPFVQEHQVEQPSRIHLSARLLMGVCCFEMGQLQDALEHFAIGAANANKCGETEMVGTFHHEMSMVAYRQGNLQTSLDHCRKAVSILLEASVHEFRKGFLVYYDFDLDSIAPMLNQQAVLYQALGDFENAKIILDILRNTSHKSCNLEFLSTVLHESGLVQFELGLQSQGLADLFEALAIKTALGQDRSAAMTLHNLRSCLLKHPDSLTDPRLVQVLQCRGRFP
jgi:tetratricopeptide (TPR) repeat protein